MKKKFGLFALVLAVLLCGSLFLLAACDETEEDPADTPATISVTVNGTAQTSGGTYSATVGTAYTFAATASNGNAVTISYVFGDAEAEELEGTSFTPETAGSYAFTFTAEDATSFTLTLVAAEAETPPATQYTVTYVLGNGAADTAVTPDPVTVAAGTVITLPDAPAAKEDFTFVAWSDDGKTEYAPGASYTVNASVTISPIWEGSGSSDPAPIMVSVGDDLIESGEIVNGTAGVSYTITAVAGYAVSATVSYNNGAAQAISLTDGEYTFTPGEAGSYVFTFTAQDLTPFTFTFNVAAAHTHSYVWSVEPGDEPLQSDGTATGLCSCGDETTRTLPLMTQENMVEDAAAVGKYFITYTQQGSCTQATIAEIVYTFDDNVTVTFTLSEPAHGHNAYQVEIAYDAEKMQSEWTATVRCPNCGDTMEVTVPAVDASDTANWEKAEDMSGSGATCTEPGKATYQYETEQNGEIVIVYVSGVTDPEAPASGHDYQISYTGGTVTAYCSFCDFEVSAEVTISGGGATGETVLSEKDFSIDKEGKTFTVTLPENGYTYDGHTFSGWFVGGETYTAGQTVTVAAGNTLEIVAQWTAVNVPQISLVVKVDGQHPIETPDGGNMPACVGTKIHYAASVSEGQVTVSYTLNDGAAQSLPAEGEFDFAEAGKYVFTITAPGADDYTFTVNVKEHEWGAWEVTSAPSDSEEGKISGTCSVTNHTFSPSVPVLTEENVTVSNEEGKYTVTVTKEATCTESGSATYIYNIPLEYGGGTIEAATVTLPQLEHSYGAATVDEATGNIIQTCANCPATQTLATLTGLSVGWAEGKQGWYTVGGTINASDFDVTYTYEDDVAAYEDIIKAAITNDITNTDKTATTGIKTVTFTLGGQSASIDVMVYAANETNGAKVLSAQEGTVTTTDGAAAGLTVAKIPEVSTNGLAITFRTVQMRITSTINSSDWDSAAIIGVGTAAGLNVTMPNLQANTYAPFNEQIFPQAANLFNGGVWDSFIRTVGQVVTISIDSTTGISYYSNGVLKVRYAPTDALGGSTVANFITILLGSIETEGFTFAGSGFAADDLYITYALGDSQAAALYNTVLTEVNTGTLLSGINGVTVYDSVAGGVSKYVAGPISGIADQGSTGLSISFRLDALYNAPDTRNWDDIVLGTSVELDVCLGVLEAWANTSASMAGDYNYFTPSTGSATYFRDLQTLGGYLTITLSATEGISYYYDGDLVVQYSTGTQSTQNAEVTVATLVNAIFAEIAVNGFDVCENVSVSDLLITSALTEEQAATLYNNYQSLNA